MVIIKLRQPEVKIFSIQGQETGPDQGQDHHQGVIGQRTEGSHTQDPNQEKGNHNFKLSLPL